ncbi:MAG: alpha-glucan family phosphorylase [Candidatus Hodarchaeales archaeon]
MSGGLGLWYSSRNNPIYILRHISGQRLAKMASNQGFMDKYHQVYAHFKQEMEKEAEHLWWKKEFPEHSDKIIAYLSMEYGIHNSLPIFSGGLGILSGDHLKESSDLGIPIVAAGFLYQEGYFTQRISSIRNGWQEEIYREYDFNDLPVEEVLDPVTKQPLLVGVDLKGDITLYVKIWKVNVGRIKLYLMDTNINENPPWYCDLTDRLYGGNTELRLQQEMILGFGSVRLFERLGIEPAMYHLNEGHSSFSSIERIRQLIREKKISFEDALLAVRQSTLFTTHTPVPAGHDVFPFRLMDSYFSKTIAELGTENFYSLGSYDFNQGAGMSFNMTALGMRTASRINAVSSLHRDISEKMFSNLWVQLKQKYGEKFNPLVHVTNGAHVASFVSETLQQFFNMVNDEWMAKHDDPVFWEQMLDRHVITDYDIWEYHRSTKEQLFDSIRETCRSNIQNGIWNMEMALISGALLDPKILTIGFGRRFATYKRATLIFSDVKRLKKIVNDPYRPVQFIFAGKAHPADDPGKALIQQIVNYAKNPELGHRIVFLENYDLVLAKTMLQGVDVWLNTPLKPNEASGTSGMKASMNFIPNLSILDGWWVEGYNGENGWVINPANKEENSREAQDWNDARSLYDILENEIIPLYYDSDPDNIPFNWIKVLRQALLSNMPRFSARRMLKEYSRELYAKCLANN